MSSYQNPSNFASSSRTDTGHQYLDATVRTSSPAKLRLMLIERSVEIAANLARDWRAGKNMGANAQSLSLLEFLAELLAGVTGSSEPGENETCQRVADLYVFLTQHLVRAEDRSDADAIDEIGLVLTAEAETWRAVVAMQSSPPSVTTTPHLAASTTAFTAGGLNLQG